MGLTIRLTLWLKEKFRFIQSTFICECVIHPQIKHQHSVALFSLFKLKLITKVIPHRQTLIYVMIWCVFPCLKCCWVWICSLQSVEIPVWCENTISVRTIIGCSQPNKALIPWANTQCADHSSSAAQPVFSWAPQFQAALTRRLLQTRSLFAY